MIDLNIPNSIMSIIENKKSAIVGPAGYLEGKNYGSKIDKHDVVVRPNSFALPINRHKDYGSRTDVMCHNMASCYLSGLQEQVNNNAESFCKLKAVIGSATKASNKDSNYLSWPDNHISECATNFDKLKHACETVPYWWIGVSNYRKMYKMVGAELYTGIAAIIIVTACRPYSVYLTGFDFYTGKRLYTEGYLSNIDKNQEFKNRGGGHGPHATARNKTYVKNWYNNKDFTDVDDTIKNIL